MRSWRSVSVIIGSVIFAVMTFDTANANGRDASSRRPNILLIVADDLGFTDIGAYGSEIKTPNLNKLAMGGVRLTNFHTAPTCSPARAMLMTGNDSHRVGLGSMGEILTDEQRRHPGYEGYMTASAATIAERLREAGYTTLMSGKWHLGLEPDQWPVARGFDRSFALLQGAANHFGADQNSAWQQARRRSYVEDDARATYPVGAYSTDHYTDKLLSFLDGVATDTPFFAYLSFTAPHWPLQAPRKDIDGYKGVYDAGPEAVRKQRLARLKSLGLMPKRLAAHELIDVPDWSSLPSKERAIEARKMEIYAAMIDHLDQAVGGVIADLDRSGKLKNTVIFFLSDNGAEGLPSGEQVLNLLMKAAPRASLGVDTSLENMGNATSFVAYGSAWAQVSSTPFNRFKGHPTEGGTRVPAFVSGPGIKGNEISGALLHVTDVGSTILDLVGVPAASEVGGKTRFVPSGHSFLAVLTGKTNSVRGSRDSIGGEFLGGASLWRGDWKALMPAPPHSMLSLKSPGREWELYNLAHDPGETQNLAHKHPGKLKELKEDWDDYVHSNGVLWAPFLE